MKSTLIPPKILEPKKTVILPVSIICIIIACGCDCSCRRAQPRPAADEERTVSNQPQPTEADGDHRLQVDPRQPERRRNAEQVAAAEHPRRWQVLRAQPSPARHIYPQELRRPGTARPLARDDRTDESRQTDNGRWR